MAGAPRLAPPAAPGNGLRRLWAGELPLARVFWSYAVGVGTLLNLVAGLAAMAALTADATALALGLFALPIPYNVVMVVAVWRSADGYPGRRLWADLARILVLLWALAATVL